MGGTRAQILEYKAEAEAELATLRAELRQVETKSGPGYAERADNLRRAIDKRAQTVRFCDEELKVHDLIDSGRVGREAGAEQGGGLVKMPANSSRPTLLKSSEPVIGWLKARGVPVFDEEYRYGFLGAWLKARLGNPEPFGRYVARLSDEQKDMLTASNGEIVPTPISGELIDALRPASVVMASGAATVPMASSTLRVPRIVADPAATWLDEGATITPTDGDVDAVTLTARRLTALTKVSQELAEDSDPAVVGQVLARSMAAAFAVELDRVALRGSGTAPEPRGVRNQSGVTIVDPGSAGADADWTTLTGLYREIANANSETTGFVWSPRTASAVNTQTGSDGHFVAPPAYIADIPRRETTAVPTNLSHGSATDTSEIYAGRWSDLMVGMRIGFELRTLNERFADEGKIGVLGRIRADVQLRHGASFAVAIGVTN